MKRDELIAFMGQSIHTALRKVCNSTPTSLAYNAISLSKHGWTNYLGLVADALPAHDYKVVAAMKVSAKAIEHGNAESNLLKLIFEQFEENDWENAASFLRYQYGFRPRPRKKRLDKGS